MCLQTSAFLKKSTELQVQKANNLSWKIKNKSPYRPSDPKRHT